MNEEEQEKLKDKIRDNSYNIERLYERSPKRKWPGLCGTCRSCMYIERQYGGPVAKCAVDEKRRLDPGDPIIDCSHYGSQQMMTLDMMVDIARIIVPSDGELDKAYL